MVESQEGLKRGKTELLVSSTLGKVESQEGLKHQRLRGAPRNYTLLRR